MKRTNQNPHRVGDLQHHKDLMFLMTDHSTPITEWTADLIDSYLRVAGTYDTPEKAAAERNRREKAERQFQENEANLYLTTPGAANDWHLR